MSSNSCREPLKDLLRCLRSTACFTTDARPLEQCAQDPTAMRQCIDEYKKYDKCKEGLLDPRSRMRGNKALR